jgi:hypothetical protein
VQRRLVVLAGGGFAVVLWLAFASLHDEDAGAGVAAGQADAHAVLRSATAPPYVEAPSPVLPSTGALLAAPTTSLLPPRSAASGRAVPVTVTAPRNLIVGEMNDLVIGLGPNEGVGEISFAVQFDGNVLQVRAAAEGDWAYAAGGKAQFESDISDREDRLQVRSAMSGQPVGTTGGSVAVVRFQAVAPGTTSVLVTDVVVKDVSGRWVAAAVSTASPQITVDSVPQRPPEASRQDPTAAIAPPVERGAEGD